MLFRQHRVGRDGERFALLKFRTYRTSSDYRDGGDPMLTRSGAFLRRTSLDELPQLFNVIRGEMSLVGPRPVLLPFARQDSEPAEGRPGLVGPAAVNARPEASYEELKRLDREYHRTWSFAGDLKLMVLCVVVVLRGRGD